MEVSDCEELVGEVNHTTEGVTDLLSFVEVDQLKSNKNDYLLGSVYFFHIKIITHTHG